MRQNPKAHSVNVVVGECNDSYLNDIRGQHVRREHVWQAIDKAAPGPVTGTVIVLPQELHGPVCPMNSSATFVVAPQWGQVKWMGMFACSVFVDRRPPRERRFLAIVTATCERPGQTAAL